MGGERVVAGRLVFEQRGVPVWRRGSSASRLVGGLWFVGGFAKASENKR
jgi:hypothetical protein